MQLWRTREATAGQGIPARHCTHHGCVHSEITEACLADKIWMDFSPLKFEFAWHCHLLLQMLLKPRQLQAWVSSYCFLSPALLSSWDAKRESESHLIGFLKIKAPLILWTSNNLLHIPLNSLRSPVHRTLKGSFWGRGFPCMACKRRCFWESPQRKHLSNGTGQES